MSHIPYVDEQLSMRMTLDGMTDVPLRPGAGHRAAVALHVTCVRYKVRSAALSVSPHGGSSHGRYAVKLLIPYSIPKATVTIA